MRDDARTMQWTSRDVAGIVFRRRRTMTAVFLAAVATTTAYVFLAPEVYQSEAKLLVRIGRESVALDPTATTGRIISVARSRMNEINSEMEILRSRDLAEGVVDGLGVHRILGLPSAKANFGTPPTRAASAQGILSRGGDEPRGDEPRAFSLLEREKAIDVILDNLDTSVVKDSNVISASFGAADPALAQTALDRLLALYLDRHIAVHRTAGSYGFFAAETENLLENARAKLAKKGCDWVCANDVSAHQGIFGGDQNTIHLVTRAGVEDWPTQSKTQVAEQLAKRIAEHFAASAGQHEEASA